MKITCPRGPETKKIVIIKSLISKNELLSRFSSPAAGKAPRYLLLAGLSSQRSYAKVGYERATVGAALEPYKA